MDARRTPHLTHVLVKRGLCGSQIGCAEGPHVKVPKIDGFGRFGRVRSVSVRRFRPSPRPPLGLGEWFCVSGIVDRFYNPYVTREYPADYGRYVYRPYGRDPGAAKAVSRDELASKHAVLLILSDSVSSTTLPRRRRGNPEVQNLLDPESDWGRNEVRRRDEA